MGSNEPKLEGIAMIADNVAPVVRPTSAGPQPAFQETAASEIGALENATDSSKKQAHAMTLSQADVAQALASRTGSRSPASSSSGSTCAGSIGAGARATGENPDKRTVSNVSDVPAQNEYQPASLEQPFAQQQQQQQHCEPQSNQVGRFSSSLLAKPAPPPNSSNSDNMSSNQKDYTTGSANESSNTPANTDELAAAGTPTTRYRPQKYCAVCGDKAIACNFNAVTCESCKAFFRRNAFKEPRLKCLFDSSCVIDRVTRRFCSKCRLLKCFEIGMKREWILTDEQKRVKRVQIMQNKQSKQQQQVTTSSLDGGGGGGGDITPRPRSCNSLNSIHSDQQQTRGELHSLEVDEVAEKRAAKRPRRLSSANLDHCEPAKVETRDAATSCPDEADLLSGQTLLNYCTMAHHCQYCSLRLQPEAPPAVRHNAPDQYHHQTSGYHFHQPRPHYEYHQRAHHVHDYPQQHFRYNAQYPGGYAGPPPTSSMPSYSQHQMAAAAAAAAAHTQMALKSGGSMGSAYSSANSSANSSNPAADAISQPFGCQPASAAATAAAAAACSTAQADCCCLSFSEIFQSQRYGARAPATNTADACSMTIGHLANQSQQTIAAAADGNRLLYSQELELADPQTQQLKLDDNSTSTKQKSNRVSWQLDQQPADQKPAIAADTSSLQVKLASDSPRSISGENLKSGPLESPTSALGAASTIDLSNSSNSSSSSSNISSSNISNVPVAAEPALDQAAQEVTLDVGLEAQHVPKAPDEPSGNGLPLEGLVEAADSAKARSPEKEAAEALDEESSKYVVWNGVVYAQPAVAESEVKERIDTMDFSESERQLVYEVIEAIRFMFEPTSVDRSFNRNESLNDFVYFCDAALRRLIKTVKQIRAFRILSMDDQIMLLKTACFKILLLRSCLHYNDDIGGWRDRHGQIMPLSMLKKAKSLVYDKHKEILTKLSGPLRKDRMIMGFMSLVLLFDPQESLKHTKSVGLDNLIYLCILRKYLIGTQPDPLEKYERLVEAIQVINACNDEYNVFFSRNFQPEQITPLLIEIFDISINNSV